MDTRTKIAAEIKTRAVVTGYFDPVTVAHLRRLREIRQSNGPITVALSEPPDPILTAQARAEVLAALDVVDYVVLPRGCALSVELERPEDCLFFPEERADQARFQELVLRIHERHGVTAPR